MSTPAPKRVLACIRCSDRRVKCNRLSPCAACIKHNTKCEYRPRKARTLRNGARPAPEGDSLIVENTPAPVDLVTPGKDVLTVEIDDGSPPKAQITVFKPQLLQGREGTKLVDNSLWSRIAEEVSSEGEDATNHSTGPDVIRKNVQDFSYVLEPIGALKQHPSPLQIHFLWQTFVERVDPMLKILHIPSFQTAIEKATSDLDHVPKSFEAIMFAMYSMAVLSMTKDECLESFGESQKTTLAFYIGATKMALLQANFMSSTNLVVLQALTLHLFSIRQDYEPRSVWNLTGLALRIAQTVGLFIDGSLLGLSPFETEMRRRLWWKLKHHDSRAAELCGQAKFQQFDIDDKTPKIPANVNDCDISPSMTHIPVSSIKPTEMLWNIMIAELSSFASSHKHRIKQLRTSNEPGLSSEEYSALDDIRGKDTMSEEIEELMEMKHLRFCDPSKPLQLLTLIGSRCATDFIRFIAHHPRRWAQQSYVSHEEREDVWNLSLQILDRTMMMQTMPRLRQFAWIVPYFMQWSVVIHILDTLRTEPLRKDADKAWELIGTLYEMNTDILLGMDRPIYVAVGSLCLKAHLAREASSKPGREAPGYVIELQRHYQKAKRTGHNFSVGVGTEQPTSMETHMTSSVLEDSDREKATGLEFLPVPTGEDDPFWLEFGGGLDTMNFDTDTNVFMTGDGWFDFAKDSALDWAQLDSLTGAGKLV